jgi:hypothetical protein
MTQELKETTTPSKNGATTVTLPDSPDVVKTKQGLSLGASIWELRSRVWHKFYRQKRYQETIRNPLEDPDAKSDILLTISTWRGLFYRSLGLFQTELQLDKPTKIGIFGLTDKLKGLLGGESPASPALADYMNFGIDLETHVAKLEVIAYLARALNLLASLYQCKNDREVVLIELKGLFSGTPPESLSDDDYLEVYLEVTQTVANLLDAWDSFIREQLYSDTQELLMARYGYFAGRALREIPWRVKIKVVQLRSEDQYKDYKKNGPEAELTLKTKLYEMFLDTFKPDRIAYLQRQLNIVAGVLDADYQAKKLLKGITNPPKAGADDLDDDNPANNDIESPRLAISAVNISLEYWQRTIVEMRKDGNLNLSNTNRDKDIDRKPDTESVLMALGEETEEIVVKIADTTLSQPQDGKNSGWWTKNLEINDSWSADSLLALHYTLDEQAESWYEVVSGRQNLTGFKLATVAGDLIQEFSQDIRKMTLDQLLSALRDLQEQISELTKTALDATKTIAKTATDAIGKLFNNAWLIALAIGGVVAAIVIVALVIFLPSDKTGLSVLGGVGAAAASAVQGFFTNRSGQKTQADINEVASKEQKKVEHRDNMVTEKLKDSETITISAMVSSGVETVKDYIEGVFKRGLRQLNIELRLLNATLALSGPLVEYVVSRCNTKDNLDFITTVVWSKEVQQKQKERVLVAAFGSFGAFLVGSKSETENKG